MLRSFGGSAEHISLRLYVPKRAVLIVGMALLAILAVELIGQGLLMIKRALIPPPEPDPPVVCDQPNEATCPLQPFQREQGMALMSDPYTGFTWRPGYSGQWLSINSLGFRGPEISVEKPDGVLRVAFVGGSAGLGVGVHDNETIAFYLQEYLTKALGQPVEVINGSVTGFNSSQQIAQILFRLLPLNPDIVVVFNGHNDVYYGLQPDWEPHYTPGLRSRRQPLAPVPAEPRPKPRVPFAATPVGNFLTNKTAIGKLISRVVLVAQSALSQSQQDVEAANAPPPEPVEPLEMHEEALVVYRQNLERLAHILEPEGIRLILVMQPSLAAGHKPLTPSEEAYIAFARSQGFFDLLSQYYPAGVEALLQAGRATHTPAYDFTTVFDEVHETTYLDHVHLNATGSRIVAERLGEIIVGLRVVGD